MDESDFPLRDAVGHLVIYTASLIPDCVDKYETLVFHKDKRLHILYDENYLTWVEAMHRHIDIVNDIKQNPKKYTNTEK